MTTGSRQVRESRRDQLKTQLIEAMTNLAASGRSHNEISVEELANQAGISRSTFYVYFADKSELLLSWLSDAAAELAELARAWYSMPSGATKEDLHRTLGALLTAMRPYAAVLSVAGQDPELRVALTHWMGQQAEGLARHITQGQKKGSIDPLLAPTETAAWLTWMAERGLTQLSIGITDEQFARLVDSHVDITWNALYRHAPSRNSLGG